MEYCDHIASSHDPNLFYISGINYLSNRETKGKHSFQMSGRPIHYIIITYSILMQKFQPVPKVGSVAS